MEFHEIVKNNAIIVNVTDVLLLLTFFNCVSNCEDDLNNDGIVGVDDVLAIFALYGNDCQL